VLSAADVQLHAATLRSRSPEEILAWGVEAFGARLALTVSFGGPGVALAHMLHRLDERVPIVFLDTGMLFPETYEFKESFARRYGLNVLTVQPLRDPGPLYETDPDACCAIRKVEPMQRTLAGFDAWASAVRRDQGVGRAHTEVVEHHVIEGRPLVKIHPLAYWTRAQVTEYLHDNDIPHHPLLDLGYTSLGCWPCTRATFAGEDERAGRWPGLAKTECGLHTFTSLSDSRHES
jgi:phosphoadenosine phosphosulfate reductase